VLARQRLGERGRLIVDVRQSIHGSTDFALDGTIVVGKLGDCLLEDVIVLEGGDDRHSGVRT